jgi:hypothetical protein
MKWFPTFEPSVACCVRIRVAESLLSATAQWPSLPGALQLIRNQFAFSTMSSQPVPFDWQQFDERLASLMLSKVSDQIRALTHEDEGHVRFQNMGNANSMTVPSDRLKMHLLRSGEWAAPQI